MGSPSAEVSIYKDVQALFGPDDRALCSKHLPMHMIGFLWKSLPWHDKDLLKSKPNLMLSILEVIIRSAERGIKFDRNGFIFAIDIAHTIQEEFELPSWLPIAIASMEDCKISLRVLIYKHGLPELPSRFSFGPGRYCFQAHRFHYRAHRGLIYQSVQPFGKYVRLYIHPCANYAGLLDDHQMDVPVVSVDGQFLVYPATLELIKGGVLSTQVDI